MQAAEPSDSQPEVPDAAAGLPLPLVPKSLAVPRTGPTTKATIWSGTFHQEAELPSWKEWRPANDDYEEVTQEQINEINAWWDEWKMGNPKATRYAKNVCARKEKGLTSAGDKPKRAKQQKTTPTTFPSAAIAATTATTVPAAPMPVKKFTIVTGSMRSKFMARLAPEAHVHASQ